MSRSFAAFFTRCALFVGAAAVVVGVPVLGAGTSGADQAPPATTVVDNPDGHIWADSPDGHIWAD